jgi:hypothetical protein
MNGYQPKINIINDDNRGPVAETQIALNKWNIFF